MIVKYYSHYSLLSLIAVGLLTTGTASAANLIKANNATALDVASSWAADQVPGVNDTAVWDSTITDGITNALGASLSWNGLQLLNPGGPVQITAGNSLTTGLGGIDLSQASQSLTLSNNIILGTPQSWNLASGLTLTLGGNLSKTAGGAVRFGLADSTANVVLTNTANTLLTNGATAFGTVNDIDFAAVNGSQQIVGGSTLGLYLSNPSGSTPNISGTTINQVYDLNTSSSGSFGLRVSGNAVITGVRVNQPNANNIPWQLNTTTKTLTVNSILITTNAGSLPVEVTGTGYLRIGEYGNEDLLLIQNNPAAPLVFVSGLAAINEQGSTGNLNKLGAGTVEIQAPGTYAGGTRVYEGTLLIDGGGNIGSGALSVFGGSFAAATGATNSAPSFIFSGATNILEVNRFNGQFFQAASLAFSAGSRLELSYSNSIALSPTNAPLVITNAAATLSATNTVAIDIAGSLTTGQFPLIKYATLGGNGFAGFSLGNYQPHVSAYLSNNTANSSIDLVVTANNDPLKWAAGSGVWDIGLTANWQDAAGAATTYQQSGIYADSVWFEDSVSGTSPITVTLNTNVTPTALTFSTAKHYTITGTGGIGGLTPLTFSGSGTLTLATTNSFSGGLNLDGGVLAFSTLTNLGDGAISFSGGTLQYNGNSDDLSVRTVTFNSGGATINDGGGSISYANPVGNSGAGGLTKTGAGTLTLNGTNLYYGNTIVGAGTLALGVATYISNSPAILVSNSATLDVSADGPLVLQNQILAGTGAVNGGVTVVNGGVISPATNGVAGTLTINNGGLTVNGGTLALDVANPAADLLVVNGNLTLTSGTLQLNATGTLANGTYKLIEYTGSFTGAAGNLPIAGFTQAGKIAALSSANSGEIDLVVSAIANASLVWEGDGGNNYWDVGASPDWTSSGAAVTFANGDNVSFNDSSANQTVNLFSTVEPGSVTVNATANNYTFQDGSGTGAGLISGTTGLTKSGGSTLTVLTVNNNSGATILSAGTIQVGNGSTTGALGTGDITNNGALVFEQPDNRSEAGQISGTGSVSQQGSATLTLAANNSYSGGTTIGSGTLQVGAGGTTGTLGAGAVVNNSALVVDRTGAYALTNGVSGSGTLAAIGAGPVTLAGNNTYQGGTAISNGVVILGGTGAIPAAEGLYVDGVLDLQGFNEALNLLNGNTGIITNSAASGTNTLVVGDDSDSSTYSGVITENANGAKIAVIKEGAATLQLNGVSSYSGGTLVLGGELNLGPAAVIGGGITLSNNTTLELVSAGSTHPSVYNNLTILTNSTVSLNSGNLANAFYGEIIGDESGSNEIASAITFGQLTTNQFESFPGTVVITALGTVRFSTSGAVTANGGDRTLFDLEGFLYTKSGGTINFGALEGAGSVSSPTAGSQTIVVGNKGIDTTFSGTINPGTSLIKAGPGALTLTGGLSYDGSTTVSNGVLALALDSTSLDTSPTITLGSATAVIDVSGRSDDTLWLGNSIPQTLSGIGTVNGNLSQAAGSVVNAGLGWLTVTNAATFSGAVNLVFDRTNAINASEISASRFTVNSTATLTVTNAGPALQGGEVFHLFSQPVSFATVTLPAISSPLSWTNKLAIDGTLVVLGTLVNTNATTLTNTFSGGNLTLNWPADHIGWHLQAQTNSAGSGLGTNWADVANTSTTNQVSLPVNPANGAVFYRLVYP
jgi:autotransporter-associated beta strand protein